MLYVWWTLTLVLMLVGLVGTLIPFLPGTTIILAAVVLHRLLLGADRSVGWPVIVGLAVLTAISYIVELMSGSLGAKRF